ncbi:MAG: MFS transporter [Chloroflexota bacterium]
MRRPRLAGLLVDATPLRRDPAFRRLWTSQSASALGREAVKLALPLQVFLLTGSAAAAGVLSLVQLVPGLIAPLWGGALADAHDRRRLLALSQAGLGGTIAALALLSLLPQPPVLVIFACGGLMSILFGVEHPARIASVPRVVAPERLRAALALSALAFQVTAIVGPAIAGLLIGIADATAVYVFATAVYAFAAVASFRLPELHPGGAGRRSTTTMIREGIAWVRSRPTILGAFAIDIDAVVFGLPVAVFPVLAIGAFGIGPAEVGLLVAARGVGALGAALFSGWVGSVVRVGRAVLVAVAAYALATCVIGLATGLLWLAVIAIVVAGAVDVLSAVLRAAIVQHVTPDALRGRVTAIHVLLVTSAPRIGDVRATFMAELFGSQVALVAGGLLALGGVAVVARAFPTFARYREGDAAAEAS